MIKRLLQEVKEFKGAAIATPLFMLVEVVMELLIPMLLASLIDEGIEKGNMQHVLAMGGLMIVCGIGGLFGGFMGGVYGAKSSTGFARNIRHAMFERIQTYSFQNIDKFSSAGLVTRLTTDVTNLQNAFQMTLRLGMRAPATILVAMCMSIYTSPKLSLIYLVALVVLVTVMVFMITQARKLFEILMRKYDDLNNRVQENVGGIRVVKAYVREEYEKKRFAQGVDGLYDASVRAEKLMVAASPIMMGTVFTCILLISWFGAKNIVYGELTTGELTRLLSYCMQILMSLMMVAMVFVMITMSSASIKRIYEVLTEETTIKNGPNPLFNVPDGSISFENVSFSYNKTAEEPVLSNVSLAIKSGETVGIIGSTGSAKSTLVSMISRLYDVDEGRVLVGGHDVRDYDVETIRNEVSVVLQHNVLFSGSIYDNLRWGDANATDEECKRACRLACADEFIEKMPDGYNTHIEQGGTNVSGGQRQRLCIARALLKKPKVLILDDSTSAVDTATDAMIRKAFREEIPGTTKIIIAQRISSVQDADRIIVMDDGKINAFDTHERLLETCEIYRDVYESQGAGSGDFDEPGGDK